MKELFKEFVVRYESKRRELLDDLYPKRSLYKELIRPSRTPKAEDVVERESEFYREMIGEITGLHQVRGKEIKLDEWKAIIFFLKNHNERLSAQVENSGAVFATLALVAALLSLLAQQMGPQNWVLFGLTILVAFYTFGERVEKRHELARNKELINILEVYLDEEG